MKTSILTTMLAALLFVSVAPVQGADMSALEIVQKMDNERRASTESAFNRMKLTTCKYGVKNGKLKCVEKPRVKLMESAQINLGVGNKDTKSIAIILQPASEKGIGMLSWTYDASDKDNETWLYLSALGKVKRIAAGSDDEDSEPTSMFGSEITTEDMETGKLDDYTYTLLKEGDYKGRPVYVVESVATPERMKKTRYSKAQTWIDAERFVALKVQMYDKQGNLVKRMQVGKMELINDIWVTRSLTMFNLIAQRLTNMKLEAITFGVEIDEGFLTQRALTDAAFRQSHLGKLREQAK
ncbi:MAG TPA: outer membrane lipoprotein-sorting protein [Oceanospirillaceae bacterium]|nr:outer membrane lipoprotein-sorting protein [Oceanospirillaceae bacterium]